MQAHGPKRIYNPQSLEFWFGKLSSEWERCFPSEVLEQGRQWYREGLIRELELEIGQGIVHTKLEGKACYSVIEWDNGTLKVRASVDDSEVGRAIAVAGLYEIEELVVDEIAPLEEDTLSQGADSLKPAPAVEIRRTQRPARPLGLRFDVREEQLCFRVFWKENTEERPALLNGGGNGSLVEREREKLIRLASMARKAQFAYEKETDIYILRDLARVPAFLSQDLPAWRRYFQVDLEPSADRMLQGVREVAVSVRAEEARNGANGAGLNLKWIFHSGERLLDESEARRLVRGDGPVFLPDVGLVELPRETVETVRSWKPEHNGGTHAIRERYLLFSLFNEENQLGIEMSSGIEKWWSGFRKAPPKLKGTPEILRPYQKKGVEWLAHQCGHGAHPLLADEMGLGKTLQVISMIMLRPVEEKIHLVVGPASVVPVWENEWKRFFPDAPVRVLNAEQDFLSDTEPGIWLASYAQLRRHAEQLSDVRFGYAVLDEGQMIKNPDAKATKACYAIRARHRLVLTGTPLENRQLDLWSLFRYLMPGLLGSRAEFEQGFQTDSEASLKKLRTQLAPFMLRRTKNVVARELPRKVETTLTAPLGDVQRDEYARICREGLERLGGGDGINAVRDRPFMLFSLLTRLRQICCDPDLLPWISAPLHESGKINLLMEKLPEILATGHKIVIFSQFVRLLERIDRALENAFPEIPRFTLNGATRRRDEPVRAFQELEGPGVILVSLRAGGTGITLHSADYVFLLDPWWNPAVEEQAIDRVHRIGQRNTVFVYRLLTGGTIEERIQDLKWSKQDIFRNLIGRLDSGNPHDNLNILCDLVELRSREETG